MASVAKRPDGRWRARYRDEAGKEHSKHFMRRHDAQRWLDEVTAAVVTGQYVDPAAGRVTFETYYSQWSQRQVWESTTVRAMDLSARSVTFADVPLAKLRRSHLEQWVKTMSAAGLAAGTIRTRMNNVRSVLRAAVRDRVMATDPSDGVPLPRERRREAAMTLPTTEQVAAILAGSEEWFRPLVALAAFAGLRLGEAAAVQVGRGLPAAHPHRAATGAARYGRCRRGPGAKVRQRAGGVPPGPPGGAARSACAASLSR